MASKGLVFAERLSHRLAVPLSKVTKCMEMLLLKLHSPIELRHLFPVCFRVQPCYHDHKPMLTDRLQELWDRSCLPPCSDLHRCSCTFQWKGMEILPIYLLLHF